MVLARPLRSDRETRTEPPTAVNAIAHPLSHHKDVTLLFLKHLRPVKVDEQPARALSLAADLQRLGPVFRRMAQAFATRADQLPMCYLEAFHRLPATDEGFPHEVEPMETVEKIVEDELGGRLSRTFSSFEPTPHIFTMAGQVHHATLVGGRDVTVKVQRPTVRARIVRDLDSVAEICAFLDKQLPGGNSRRLARVADRLRVNMLRELDYRGELAAIAELGKSFAGFPKLRLPVPLENYTSSRVLTAALAPAVPIAESAEAPEGESRSTLASELVALFVELSLLRGVFPTDFGPESLSLTPGGSLLITTVKSTARLGFRTRSNLLLLLTALLDRDYHLAASSLTHIAGKPAASPATESLARELMATDAATHTGDRLIHAARVAVRHGFLLPHEIATFSRTLDALGQAICCLSPGTDPATILREQIEAIQPAAEDKTISFPAALGSVG